MKTDSRIGIVGATTLLGKELGVALRESGLSSRTPTLLQAGSAEPKREPKIIERSLVAFDDEPAVVETLDRAQAAELDVLFLAGTPEESRLAWQVAQSAAAMVIDLTGALAGEKGAALAGWDEIVPGDRADGRGVDLVVTAHPAAQALTQLLKRLGGAGRCSLAAAIVFEPASERGLAGIQELEQQTVRMLSLQSQPQAVYEAQVAFNLRASLGGSAQPSLEQVRQRIAGETRRLAERGAAPPIAPPIAIELLQAPLFHASVISLYVRYAEAVEAAAVEACCAGLEISRSEDYPDVLSAASQDEIQLGPVRAEAEPAGGFWLFATLDNLRRSANSAVAAAQSRLRAQ